MRDISSKNKIKPNNLVQTIERVSLILDVLGKYSQGIGIRELSEKLSFPKGTIHRLLSSLAYFDYARKDPISKKYRLGFKLMELGNCLLNHLDFQDEKGVYCVGAPIMDRKGRVIAAISISGPSFRLTPQILHTLLKVKIMKTALNISKKLGYPER
jgi:DNA-binding IclR family transcriptional regulator